MRRHTTGMLQAPAEARKSSASHTPLFRAGPHGSFAVAPHKVLPVLAVLAPWAYPLGLGEHVQALRCGQPRQLRGLLPLPLGHQLHGPPVQLRLEGYAAAVELLIMLFNVAWWRIWCQRLCG